MAGGAMRAAVCREAARWIGTPYRHQASRRGVGCDCLGLVLGIWRSLYGHEPERPGPYAPDWAETGEDRLLAAARRHLGELPVARAEPGDLVLFRWRPHLVCMHAGVLTAPDRFVHAYQGTAVVASVLVPQWRRRMAAAFSFPDRES
jgi:NlpC/P60 family putative phage cell wall peptidase